jgi:long-chain acyl-CoA synthetase
VESSASATATHHVCRATDAEEAKFAELMRTAPASFGAMFLNRVHDTPRAESFRRRNDDGSWTSETWAETGQIVCEIAAGLLELGLQPEERVALASTTRVEWIHADLAVLCAGGATTTIYPTSSLEDVQHILTDSGARFAIAENTEQAAKLRADSSELERVILIDGPAPEDDPAVFTLAGVRELGLSRLARDPEAVVRAAAAVRSDQLSTLIYTSGTTGRPKGVRIAHSNWVYEGLATLAIGIVSQDDVGYLWLPMSHVFGKTLLASQLASGHAAAVDGDVTRIITNLPVVKPTTMASAPRVFEKVYAGVKAKAKAEGGAKYRIFTWAIGVGLEVSKLRQAGNEPTGLLAMKHAIADRLVFSKIRERFGGRVEFLISGAASLSRDVSDFFHAVGLLILEGYGLTESSAGTFVNRRDRWEFGTVGTPMPGTQVRLAEDGEILLKGPGIMQGYHNLDEATQEVLNDDGWLHTGDVGEITEKGSLRITDRKKDLIKTSGGKYVAPQPIEVRFKALCPLASNIVVHGEGRHFITALIALDPDALKAFATAQGISGSFAELSRSPQVRTAVQHAVDAVNQRLGRWETIKSFSIIDRDLTVESGDLTPSLKLKRRHVEKEYASVLDDLYRGDIGT